MVGEVLETALVDDVRLFGDGRDDALRGALSDKTKNGRRTVDIVLLAIRYRSQELFSTHALFSHQPGRVNS